MRCLIFTLLVVVISAHKGGSPKDPKYRRHHDDDHNKHYDGEGHHNVEYDRVAFFGSESKAKEFFDLKPAEALVRMEKIFNLMDVDKDRKVSQKELEKWVHEMLKEAHVTEHEEEFEDYDKNHDGKMSWLEYLEEEYGYEHGDDLSEYEDEEEMDLWKAADLNSDGSLSKHEYPAFVDAESYDHMFNVLLKHQLDAMDTDEDGLVSYAEFKKDRVGQFHIKEFGNYDLDNNKKLDPAEMRLYMQPYFEDESQVEAEHLIGEVDKDGDGLLSLQEIQQNMPEFMHSDATIHGEKLRGEL